MKRVATVLLTLCLLAGVPVSAGAAAAENLAPMDVQVWPGAEPGQLLVIVGVTLPEKTRLPATVKIPVIEGMDVLWAGEIGDPQQGDLQHEFELKKGVGGQYAQFEVTNSRQAQVELGLVPLTQTSDGLSGKVDYVQTVPIEQTSFSVRLPPQVTDVKITPAPTGAPDRNDAGEALYTLPSKELKAGGKQSITVSYKIGTTPAASSAPSTNTILAVLLGLIAVGIVALVVIMARQRARAAGADEEGYDEGDDADDPQGGDPDEDEELRF